MNRLTQLFTIGVVSLSSSLAMARDLGPDEALRLRDAGTIKSFEQLNAAAVAKHPGSSVTETELEQEHGRYVYQVDLLDTQGLRWELRLDASSGEVLQDRQDD